MQTHGKFAGNIYGALFYSFYLCDT